MLKNSPMEGLSEAASVTIRQPRMLELYEAAQSSRGDVAAILRGLSLSASVLRQRLSNLKAAGVARTVTIIDPSGAGRECEALVLVRIQDYRPGAVAAFEAALVADVNVMSAAQVTGWFDYQLACAFGDLREGQAWARALELKTEVAQVRFRWVRTRWGHGIFGLVLWPSRAFARLASGQSRHEVG